MADRTATPRRTSGKEPARRSLTERLQDTMSNAAQEHRANAETGTPRGRRASRAPGRQPRRARLHRFHDFYEIMMREIEPLIDRFEAREREEP